MPPENQSPHRFLPGQRQPSPSKVSKKPLAQRRPRGDGFSESIAKPTVEANRPVAKPADVSRGDGFTQSTPTPKSSSDQFAQTPRFSSGHWTVPSHATRESLSTRPSLAQALRASLVTESVDDATVSPTSDDDDVVFLNNPTPTTELIDQQEGWVQDLPHSPKRRRVGDLSISFQAALNSTARPTMFKPPTTPASALRRAPQQFARASSVANSVADDGNAGRRPAFLKSSVAPAENYAPLPDAFSPHRRGEKFVPGGMAATLQQWVVEMGQSVTHGRRGQGYLQGEAYSHHVKVESISGRGPMLVQGRKEDGAQVQFLLISDGRSTPANIHLGSIVGVREPSWEVEVDEVHSWIVGVDWRTLS